MPKILRLILGDQLNPQHSWYQSVDHNVVYTLMEVRQETDYTTHHIQKVLAFFAAMRDFAGLLKKRGHHVIYIPINDPNNQQDFSKNLNEIIANQGITKFEYQEPDEYRLDAYLKSYCKNLTIESKVFSTEHFYTSRTELGDFFAGKKTYLMESFYRHKRKKHQVLVTNGQPEGGQWNFDHENRNKLPNNHLPPNPIVFSHDFTELEAGIAHAGIKTIGSVDAAHFIWPVNREESLLVLHWFLHEALPYFGKFQDALTQKSWSVYHSRLSFSLNTKMIGPQEVCHAAIAHWRQNKNTITLAQTEGFVRQILGWREFMRGVYWANMPGYAGKNFFDHQNKLPQWFWTGQTKMRCMRSAIGQSLQFAYAHHIQRLMVTGNFALLAGIHPDEVDAWYLGIYIDALDWVEITNTRGMSQFADGGLVATKPYVSSANYINKMSDYCGSCAYRHQDKVGEKACPFNSLYWHFFERNRDKLEKNPRIGMAYRTWDKMLPEAKSAILAQAEHYLANLEKL